MPDPGRTVIALLGRLQEFDPEVESVTAYLERLQKQGIKVKREKSFYETECPVSRTSYRC